MVGVKSVVRAFDNAEYQFGLDLKLSSLLRNERDF